MSGLTPCDGTSPEISSFLNTFQVCNCIVLFILVSLCAAATLCASYQIFWIKTSEQRPRFVTLQMFFLNCFWVIMTIYIFSLGVQSLNDNEVLVQQKAW